MCRTRNTRAALAMIILLTVSVLAPANSLWGQQFVKEIHEDEAGAHAYHVYLPAGYSAEKKLPVILYLHGAGERGSDGMNPLNVGLAPVLKQRREAFPFVAVFPQCEDRRSPILSAWNAHGTEGQRAIRILDEAIAKYSLDPKRQVLTGWSMGSFGVVSLAEADPDRWLSVVTLSGGGVPRHPERLKQVPFLMFHGQKDGVVLPDQCQLLADALHKVGNNSKLTIIKDGDHSIWMDVYRWEGLYRWMLDPATASAEYEPPAPLPKDSPLASSETLPFKTALEIPNAAYVRLGNNMLSALAESIPAKIPADLLRGRLNTITDRTTADGRTFNVWFSHITYSGSVSEAYIEAYRKNRLNIQLGLRNVRIRIGRTDVAGDGKSAVTGPIDVVIGHREPVWLSVALEPTVKDRQLKLKLIATRFDIPRGNWYVTSPAVLDTDGFGMTKKRVRESLVKGLYGSQARIEQQVESIVPALIERLEKNLQVEPTSDLISHIWPLPVYRPRVKVWPDKIVTDENGMTVFIGLSEAAYDPMLAPERPIVDDSISLDPQHVTPSTDLNVGVASDLLRPLTAQLLREDVGRIHLGDVPGNPFEGLLDGAQLAKAIPDVARFGPEARFRAEFIMLSPISLITPPVEAPQPEEEKPSPETESAASPLDQNGLTLDLSMNPARILFTVQPSESEPWQELAIFDVMLRQGIRLDVKEPEFHIRKFDLGWTRTLKLSAEGRFAEGYQPQNQKIDNAAFAALFEASWLAWISETSQQELDIPDINFGLTRLRLSSAGWKPPEAFVRFSAPGIKITNASDVELKYQLRFTESPWSEELTLLPGKSHYFDGAENFIYRQRSRAGTVIYTLPAGSHSVYRTGSAGEPPGLRLK